MQQKRNYQLRPEEELSSDRKGHCPEITVFGYQQGSDNYNDEVPVKADIFVRIVKKVLNGRHYRRCGRWHSLPSRELSEKIKKESTRMLRKTKMGYRPRSNTQRVDK